MKRFILGCLLLLTSTPVFTQNNNPASIYEGIIIQQIDFSFTGNFTLKYFHSKQWYFHLNAAYAIPGSTIRDNLNSSAKDWFCATVFARYSF